MNCQAKSYCKLYNTNHCNDYCGVYSVLQAIYSLSNIPTKYQYVTTLYASQRDVDAFTQLCEYRENVEDNVKQGKGLYIWSSNSGNGKTSWATNIANEYIRKAVKHKKIDNVVLYINIPTYLEGVRRSFDAPDGRVDEINEQVLESDLVIFDDIGAERPSDWVRERLYQIINHRDNELKASIFTSNVSPYTLQENLGQRIYSRITANEVIELKGGDRRCMSNK